MEKSKRKSIDNKVGSRKNYWTSMLIIGMLFFIFGFVTWLNSILIPYLKIAWLLLLFIFLIFSWRCLHHGFWVKQDLKMA
jgi:FHS family L-fucose permease-like MFS transporter